jgi:site-specific recombinase XerD
VVRVVNGKGMKDRELPVIPRLEAILRSYLEEVRSPLVGRPMGSFYLARGGRPTGLKYYVDGVKHYQNLSGQSADEAAKTRAALAPTAPASPYVFINASPVQSHRVKRAGLPLVSRLVLRIVREVVGPIVGRKVYTHMLRHSFASRLRENGADLQDIQEALGHSVITTTTMYAHISTRRRREKLAEYLK